MFEIIPSYQPEQWNGIVRSMNQYDFYHLAEYHRLEQSGQSLLLHFFSKGTSLALPVILRSIDGTEYRDITSVYGYAGPLCNQETPDEQIVKDFQKEFLNFCDSLKVVSAFSRLHPLFNNQELILSRCGEVVDTNLTVAIDLSLPEQEQKKQYARSTKYNINRLRRKNILVSKAQTKEEIDLFIEIYKENMNRVNASKMYFFPNNYFYRLMEELPATLFLAYYEGKAICGALSTTCKGIVQAHLNATLDSYLPLSPLKLVWDCIRLNAIERKEKWLHLGGGVGGMNDTLFQFKARFSNLRFTYKTWRYIHNAEAYNQLISTKYLNHIPDSSFFPLYRLE
jgi:hypothetical protein